MLIWVGDFWLIFEVSGWDWDPYCPQLEANLTHCISGLNAAPLAYQCFLLELFIFLFISDLFLKSSNKPPTNKNSYPCPICPERQHNSVPLRDNDDRNKVTPSMSLSQGNLPERDWTETVILDTALPLPHVIISVHI